MIFKHFKLIFPILRVQQDSSVRSYLDCQWVSTDILRRDSLDIPEDADVVIGYLFSVSHVLCYFLT